MTTHQVCRWCTTTLIFQYAFKLLPHEDINMQWWLQMDLGGTILVLKDWHSLGMVAHVCNLSTWEAEPEGLWIQSQPGVHSKYEASLGDIARLCEKNPLGLGCKSMINHLPLWGQSPASKPTKNCNSNREAVLVNVVLLHWKTWKKIWVPA